VGNVVTDPNCHSILLCLVVCTSDAGTWLPAVDFLDLRVEYVDAVDAVLVPSAEVELIPMPFAANSDLTRLKYV